VEKITGCSVEVLVARDGWAYFRETERQVVETVAEKNNLVIATVGGVVMNQTNMANLGHRGMIVWLDAELEVLHKRMAKDQRAGQGRPSLTGGDVLQEIEQLMVLRRPLYAKAATITVDTSHLIPAQVASSILEAYKDRY